MEKIGNHISQILKTIKDLSFSLIIMSFKKFKKSTILESDFLKYCNTFIGMEQTYKSLQIIREKVAKHFKLNISDFDFFFKKNGEVNIIVNDENINFIKDVSLPNLRLNLNTIDESIYF